MKILFILGAVVAAVNAGMVLHDEGMYAATGWLIASGYAVALVLIIKE